MKLFSYTPRRAACGPALAIVLLAALLAPALAQAKPGNLDRSFGGDGKVRTDLCGPGGGSSVAIDRHGRIVVLGGGFCLARYRRNGHLDRAFGDHGKVIPASPGGGSSVTIDSHGRIVVAGGNFDSGDDFVLARYRPNGSLDASFGAGGEVTTGFGGSHGAARSVAIDSKGRIVAAGVSCNADYHNCDFTLARYKTNGSLDPSFGVGGKVTTDFGGRDEGESVAIDSRDRIVAAGDSCTPNYMRCDFALARYKANGSLDPSFGVGGKVTTTFRSWSFDRAFSAAIDSRGRIIAAGYTILHRNGHRTAVFALARYKPDGNLNRSFSRNGKVTTHFGHSATARSVAIDSRGRIVAAGDDSFKLARYKPDGTLDRSFSGNGKTTAGFGAFAWSAAIDPEDRIVVAGSYVDVVLARFIG
jgi:uncharacterized delta-60 repeat protein